MEVVGDGDVRGLDWTGEVVLRVEGSMACGC